MLLYAFDLIDFLREAVFNSVFLIIYFISLIIYFIFFDN